MLPPNVEEASHELAFRFLGTYTSTMNWAIYQSFARIPLGVAVTVEFIGPLAVTAGAS